MKLFFLGFLFAFAASACGDDDPYCCALRTFHTECKKAIGTGYPTLLAIANEGDEKACKTTYEEIREDYGCRSSTSPPFFEPAEALAMCE